MVPLTPLDEPDYRDRIRERLEEFYGRPPRFRYFPTPDNGPRFFWTVETANHNGQERYISGVFKPIGKGSRSGDATTWQIDPDLTSGHRLRKDAKARALRLRREHLAGT
jgi:hypothetical protein